MTNFVLQWNSETIDWFFWEKKSKSLILLNKGKLTNYLQKRGLTQGDLIKILSQYTCAFVSIINAFYALLSLCDYLYNRTEGHAAWQKLQ